MAHEHILSSHLEQGERIHRLAHEVRSRAAETIHTQNAYKYSLEEIDALARSAGLRPHRRWLDSANRFRLNLLAPGA